MIKQLTREIAKTMTKKQLGAWDIKSPEEEIIIQEILLGRAVVSQPVVKFNSRLVPDIKTPEQEKEWQGQIDEFNKKNSPVEAQIAEAEKILESVEQKIQEVVVTPSVVTVDNRTGDIIKPFCHKCTSKGVRHKKECPLYVPTVKSNADTNSSTVQPSGSDN